MNIATCTTTRSYFYSGVWSTGAYDPKDGGFEADTD
jgi:hypothetical protein